LNQHKETASFGWLLIGKKCFGTWVRTSWWCPSGA
jgi:hypothetical protein